MKLLFSVHKKHEYFNEEKFQKAITRASLTENNDTDGKLSRFSSRNFIPTAVRLFKNF